MVGIEIDDAGTTITTGERRYIENVRFGHHGLHRGIDIVVDKLVMHMSIENRPKVCNFGCFPIGHQLLLTTDLPPDGEVTFYESPRLTESHESVVQSRTRPSAHVRFQPRPSGAGLRRPPHRGANEHQHPNVRSGWRLEPIVSIPRIGRW